MPLILTSSLIKAWGTSAVNDMAVVLQPVLEIQRSEKSSRNTKEVCGDKIQDSIQ